MDYEKKYKEALALAHSYYDKDSMNAFLDTIFPELKENEDEKIRKALVWHLKADVDFVSNGVTKAECLAYLDKQKAQKQEWSEEDEKMIDTIVSVLGQYIDYKAVSGTGSGYATPRYSKEIAWLKSLRPQPKDQDVEKYPEDKSFEDEWKDYYNNSLVSRQPMNKREVAKHFYWFAKKNAWKPSEEQMEALNALNLYGNISYVGQQNQLISLYQDLKKLM